MKLKNLIPQKKWQRLVLAAIVVCGAGGLVMAPACSAVGKTPSGGALKKLELSAQYKNGEFVNVLPAKEPPFWDALKEWAKGGDHTTPENSLPMEKRSTKDYASAPQSGLRITWIGHSTSLIEIDGARLLLDPIWSPRTSPFSWTGPKRFAPPPLAIEDLPHIDAVLISHDHYDHLDKHTVQQLAQKGIPFVVPLGVDARLNGFGVSDKQINVLDWWQHTKINGITITATPSRHFSGRSLVMADRNKTLWAGFALAGNSHRVYYTGDTGMFNGFEEIGERLGPFDATLVEVGAYHQLWADLHLGPEQAVQAVKKAQGGMLIPVHWASFNLAMHSWVEPAERIIVAAEKAKFPYVIPKIGQRIEPASPPPFTRWWPQTPWQTAAEHPVIASGLKKTKTSQ